ncbi:hypothetical protein MRB53_038458 [Persea americana]|nr:hypothetical protein MRB53_038458 [Persea americana]
MAFNLPSKLLSMIIDYASADTTPSEEKTILCQFALVRPLRVTATLRLYERFGNRCASPEDIATQLTRFAELLSQNPEHARDVRSLRLDSWAQPQGSGVPELPKYRKTAETLLQCATDVKHISICLLDGSFSTLEDPHALFRMLYKIRKDRALYEIRKARALYEIRKARAKRDIRKARAFYGMQKEADHRGLESLDIKLGYHGRRNYDPSIGEIIADAFHMSGVKSLSLHWSAHLNWSRGSEILGTSSITTVTLTSPKLDRDNVEALLSHCEALEHLTLRSVEETEGNTVGRFRLRPFDVVLWRHKKTLKSLSVSTVPSDEFYNHSYWSMELTPLEKLESLHLDKMCLVDSRFGSYGQFVTREHRRNAIMAGWTGSSGISESLLPPSLRSLSVASSINPVRLFQIVGKLLLTGPSMLQTLRLEFRITNTRQRADDMICSVKTSHFSLSITSELPDKYDVRLVIADFQSAVTDSKSWDENCKTARSFPSDKDIPSGGAGSCESIGDHGQLFVVESLGENDRQRLQ